ncbi:MAG: transporter [Planctomycetes bacterium]|nr:transporter [Planctomycetota bacterium]
MSRPWRGIALAIVALAAAAAATRARAWQEAPREELETDRDSFTFAPSTAGAGLSIAELSYSFIDNRTAPDAHSYPELLMRRGFGDRFEARLGFNLEAGGPGLISGSEFAGEDVVSETESRVLYGAKAETTDQEGWVPRSALVVQGFTPVSGPSNKSTVMAGEVFGWRFAGGTEWNTAIRYGTGFAETDAFNQWAPSTVIKVPVGERMNVHAEYFAILSDGKDVPLNLQYASFGGHVLATENLELGIRCGWGLNDTSPRFFTNVGVGWRY